MNYSTWFISLSLSISLYLSIYLYLCFNCYYISNLYGGTVTNLIDQSTSFPHYLHLLTRQSKRDKLFCLLRTS